MLRPTQTAGGEMTSPSHGERVAPGDDVAPGVATDLRVAYLVNQYPQPSQSFIRREIAALEKRGVAIERFTLRRSTTELVDPADQAEFRRTRAVLDAGPVGLVLAVARTAMTRPAHFARALALAWRVGKRSDRGRIVHLVYLAEACVLAGWLRRDTIRHLHAHFGTNSATVAMLSQAVGGPGYSFTVHGPEEFDKPEALGLGEKIARAEWVVGISQFGRSQLLRWCDFAHWDKVHVVHCGVDGAYFSATPTPPPTAPRLVCVARLSEQKGIPLLVAAAARLAAVGVDFELRLVGDGPLRPIVERLIAEHRLGNKIKLLGWQSGQEVQREIADARALVLPSFAEGLPVVIMESLAMHRPVVCTQIAGVGELVASGVCGWVVPAGAVDALAGAMREAIEASPERLLEMGGAGARLVAQRHNADQEAARLVELLQETAAK
jgi:glycosyltransferase involved in cell wall biosynthesis